MDRIQLLLARDGVSSIYFQAGLRRGDAVWVNSKKAARELLEAGVCVWPDKKPRAAVEPDPPAPQVAEAKKSLLRRPDGWPIDRFSVIDPVWRGEVVLCIGGGPSVTRERVEAARGKARVIAVNNSYELAPWADALYFADYQWWGWHKDRKGYKEFAGQKVTIENTGERISDPDVHMLHNYGPTGLSERPNGIHTGSNGGYQAMNIAVLAGAKKVLLLGYDMRFPGGKSHWHGGHPNKTGEHAYRSYAARYAGAVEQLRRLGIEVVNCSPGSIITNFRFSEVALELP